MTKKEKIPTFIKKKVWNRDSVYSNIGDITQCKTCNNLVYKPNSINKNLEKKFIIVNHKIYPMFGVGEFGHIISEKNGGKISIENLIIQCKKCNTKNGSKNINFNKIANDAIMIDNIYVCNDIEMNEMNENNQCNYFNKKGIRCKNKKNINISMCHVHLN